MLGLTSKIADDSLNFIYSDKINPESPLYKEYIDLVEIRSNYEKRLDKMKRSWEAGDGTYRFEQQYLDHANPLKEKLNSVINRIQQITRDAGSNQAMKVIGYSSANDPKAEDFKPKPKADLGDANIVLADSRWGQLSNLADHTFTYDGREYRSVEHAYQANKSGKFHEPTYRAYFDRPEARKINTGPPANRKTNLKLMEDLYRQMLSENPDMVDLLKETKGFNITHQLKKTDIWTTEMPRILTLLRDEFDIDASRIVPKGTPGSVLAMRGGDLPNPFYYRGGGPDGIVRISEGSKEASRVKVIELHKNWIETGAVPDGLSDDQINRLSDMREKQLNIIDNLPDDYKLGYFEHEAKTSHAVTLDNFIQERKQGGTPKVKAQTFETIKWMDEYILRDNPDKIYIFGDNEQRYGKGGQAIIRDEPNAFGIATKKRPSMDDDAFFTDDEFEANKKLIDEDIAKIKADGRPIVYPEAGIGEVRAGPNLTGLKNAAPRTYEYLMGEIEKLKSGTGITPSPTKMIEVEGDFGGPGDAYRARTGRTGGTVGDITIDFVTQATYDRGAGSGATKGSTQSGKKPYQPIVVKDDGTMKGGQIDELAQIIADHLTTGKTINIAGHGAYVSPGSRTGFKQPMDQEVFNNELNKVFDKVLEIIGDQPITGKVITGGQSGYDLAGSRAAASHGIPNEAYYSSTKAEGGALFRNPDGEDIDNFEEFRKRFNRFGPGGMPPADTPEFEEWYEKEIEAKNSKEVIDDIAKNADVQPSMLRKVMGEVPGFLVVPLEAAIEVGLRYGKIAKAHPNLAKNARRFIMYELGMFAAAVVTGLASYSASKYDATNEFGYSSKDLYSSYSYDRTSEYNVRRMEEAVAYNAEITQLYEEYPELKEYNEQMAHQYAMEQASGDMDFFIKKMPTYYIDEVLFEYVPELREAREEYADKKFFSEGGWRAALAQPQLLEKGVEWTIDAILGNKRVEKKAWSYDNR